jgi:DNA-binding PadR family transcriptional regulator
MKPLNYAILKYFTTVKEACADDVIEALKGEYGNFKALKKPAVVEAIMTGEANGLLEETRFEMDDKGELKVYYRAHEEGAATINSYIPD